MIPLPPRKRQIALLVAEGKSNQQIADTLHLTHNTVRVYMSVILRATGVPNRTGLAIWVKRHEC